jgi:hypothetical protein
VTLVVASLDKGDGVFAASPASPAIITKLSRLRVNILALVTSANLDRLIAYRAPAVRTASFTEIKSLEEDNFLRFAGFRVYKCPVFGAKGNGYVSEVKDRRDRSNELYEQVAALG